MSFVHLHNHTQYSRLDGSSGIQDLAERAAELGQPALAINDHGNLFGAFKHFKACKSVGIRPIIGMEAYLAPEDRFTKARVNWGELVEDDRVRSVPGGNTHLTVIAQNPIGLRNLYKLQEISYLEGFYGYPRIDLEALGSHSEGLIILSGCAGSALSTRLRLDQEAEATELAVAFHELFPGRYFIEVMGHDIDFELELNKRLFDLAHKLNLPVVATNDSHYTRSEDAQVHDAMLCLNTGSRLSDSNRFRFSGSGFYLKSTEEMNELFRERPDALKNTLVIADMIEDYDEIFREAPGVVGSREQVFARQRPDSDVRDVRETRSDLRSQAYSGLENKGLANQTEYRERLEYELQVISELGFEDYISIIADLCAYARDRGILVGPARGSAAGSLVCFCLGITAIDPLVYSLVFERFLNPARKSPPDVDIDFQKDRRDEIFTYAAGKYGADRVAKIITFATMASRYAIKDAARVLGRDAREAQRLANFVPPLRRGRQASLDEVPELAEQDPEVYGLALGLEGMIRGYGKHAAGLAISSVPLSDIMPVKKDPKDDILMTGFENSELEELGIIKIDVLGLDNLTTIAKCLEMIV